MSTLAPAARGAMHAVAGLPQRAWWPWAKGGLVLLFFAFIGTLLYHHANDIDWRRVWQGLKDLPKPVLVTAAGVAALGHLLYSTFDLLGRRYTRHKLPAPLVMAITFTSYAFNLNLGSLVGGVGLRYRLYSRFGLRNGAILRVLSVSLFTNWFGFMVLAGFVFALFPLPLPAQWGVGNGALRALGIALLGVAIGWIVHTATTDKQEWAVAGRKFPVPSPRMTALQLAMSCANWMLIAAVIWVLLQGQVSYPTVLAVYLLASIAGVVTYVPAGLGVLEAVFVLLLGSQVGETKLLTALLAYRAVYYLGPLALAALSYPLLEAFARHHGRQVRSA